ncbi:MAG: SMC-Scp complex subunit ScpB [Planctomycetota bacterium]
MDDIMRDHPVDAGSLRSRSERNKGPEELALLARGVAAEDLVLDTPRITGEGEPLPTADALPLLHAAALHSDAQHADAQHTDALPADALHTDAQHTDALPAAAQHTDAQHTDAQHADALHTDAQHTDAQHTDAQHADALHTDALHADAQHTDALHADALHADALPAAALHTDAQHTDALPADALRTAAQHTDALPADAQQVADEDSAKESHQNPEPGEPSALVANLDCEIRAEEALAALAAEADTIEIDEESAGSALDGLPPVPELTDPVAASKILFVLMLTTREGLPLMRLAQACNSTLKVVEQSMQILQQDLLTQGLPLELSRTGDTFKLISIAALFPYLTRLRGVKKLERLSPAALETLAVIAYKQPVMRAEIESIRGVKAAPMLRTLLQHKLVRVTGRADVPGRPLQYGTTQQFLERFGLASLQDLPSQHEFKQIH